MSGGWIVFWMLLVAAIIGVMIVRHQGMKWRTKMNTQLETTLASIAEFSPDHQIVGEDGKSGIAIDEARGTLCLLTWSSGFDGSLEGGDPPPPDFRLIQCSDLLLVETFEGGISVQRTKRSSQLGGALVGTLLAGGVGALIGGLSGTKVSTERARRVDVRLLINDTSQPIHDISFLNFDVSRDSELYLDAIARGEPLTEELAAALSVPE